MVQRVCETLDLGKFTGIALRVYSCNPMINRMAKKAPVTTAAVALIANRILRLSSTVPRTQDDPRLGQWSQPTNTSRSRCFLESLNDRQTKRPP